MTSTTTKAALVDIGESTVRLSRGNDEAICRHDYVDTIRWVMWMCVVHEAVNCQFRFSDNRLRLWTLAESELQSNFIEISDEQATSMRTGLEDDFSEFPPINFNNSKLQVRTFLVVTFRQQILSLWSVDGWYGYPGISRCHIDAKTRLTTSNRRWQIRKNDLFRSIRRLVEFIDVRPVIEPVKRFRPLPPLEFVGRSERFRTEQRRPEIDG